MPLCHADLDLTPSSSLSSRELIAAGVEVLRIESEAVARLAGRIGEPFAEACRVVLACHGRIIVTGIGKSGAVARKAAATLASTGAPSLFLHPAEGMHGDLGMVTPQDVVIVLSYSGESDEILALLPGLKRLAAKVIAVTGRPGSTLGQAADVVLEVSVTQEACPLNLAPTASTTAMLALLDALAIAAMKTRRFTEDDFAALHPAGALGRRLLLRVGDLMRQGDRLATVAPEALVREALFAITRAQAGCAFVVDEQGMLLGLLSDGDIRRLLVADEAHLRSRVREVMVRTPRYATADRLVTEALAMMEQPPPFAEMPVLDAGHRIIGVLNLKDILHAGII
jgi:arabinose-5-phosphate isomerase